MKRHRNRNLKNSLGISKKEYLLGSSAGRMQNKELSKDYDYLDKLSSEDLAWMAEFNAAYLCSQLADETIVGKDNAENLNHQENRRAGWRREKGRRFDALVLRSKSVDYGVNKNESDAFQASDSYAQMLEDIEESVDTFWAEKHR